MPSKRDGVAQSSWVHARERGGEREKKVTSTIHHQVYLLGDEINIL